jgi:hypothetical protein
VIEEVETETEVVIEEAVVVADREEEGDRFRWFREFRDLVHIVHQTSNIVHCKSTGKQKFPENNNSTIQQLIYVTAKKNEAQKDAKGPYERGYQTRSYY